MKYKIGDYFTSQADNLYKVEGYERSSYIISKVNCKYQNTKKTTVHQPTTDELTFKPSELILILNGIDTQNNI